MNMYLHLSRRLTSGPRRPEDLALFLDTAWQLLQLDGEEDRVLHALADRGTATGSIQDGSSSSSSVGAGGLLLLQQLAQSTAAGADCKLHSSASMQQVHVVWHLCHKVGMQLHRSQLLMILPDLHNMFGAGTTSMYHPPIT
jgi:hypothetical protein